MLKTVQERIEKFFLNFNFLLLEPDTKTNESQKHSGDVIITIYPT